MKFVLKIDSYDNDAMHDDPSVATSAILEEAIDKIDDGARSGSLSDANGNKVGSFEFLDEED